MPLFCYVPGCRHGPKYLQVPGPKSTKEGRKRRPEEKEEEEEETDKKSEYTCFKLPKQATLEVRNAWLEAIPSRKDLPFNPSSHYICNLHFDEEVIWNEEETILMNGKEVTYRARRFKRLKKGAIPTRFPARLPPIKLMKYKPVEKKKEEIEEETIDLTEATEEDYCFEEEIYRKEYFCVFCLNSWMARIVTTEFLEKKGRLYKRFLRYLAKYSEVKGGEEEVDKVFGENGELVRYAKGGMQRKVDCDKLTVCSVCGKIMEEMCTVLEQLEVLKMKTNERVREVVGMLREGEERGEREQYFGKWMGKRKLEEVKTCHGVVKKVGDKLLVPQIRLKRCDLQREPEPDIISVPREPLGTPAPPEKNIQPKESEVPTSLASGDPNVNLFCGGNQLRRLVSSGRILCCSSCGKCCDSEEQLNRHQQTFHSEEDVDMEDNSGVESGSEEHQGEEEEVGSVYCPSAPGSPMEVGSCDDEDDDFQELRGVDVTEIRDNEDDAGDVEEIEDTRRRRNRTPLPPEVNTLEVLATRGNLTLRPEIEVSEDIRKSAGAEELEGIHSKAKGAGGPTLVLNESLLQNAVHETGRRTPENLEVPRNILVYDLPPPPEPGSLPTSSDETFGEASERLLASLSPKPEEPPTLPKKVPFMSSEYIGKYKILCKLKNLQTGKTVFGVVAQPNLTTPSTLPPVPKVISTEPLPKKKKSTLPRFISLSGPPFSCTVTGCTKSYPTRKSCIHHIQRHRRKRDQLQKDMEAGIPVDLEKERRIPEKKPRTYKTRKAPVPEFNFYCDAPDCDFGFQKKFALDYHRQVLHSPVECHFCSKPVLGLAKLIKHEMTHLPPHPENRPLENSPQNLTQCPRCDFRLTYPKNKGKGRIFIRHYRQVHLHWTVPRPTGPKQICPQCSRTFSTRLKLNRHRENFHGETIPRPFGCTQCQRQFAEEISLKHHQIFSHSGKSQRRQVLRCNICSGVYTIRRHYDYHMKRHTENKIDAKGKLILKGNPEDFPFPCDQCHRRFDLEGRLWNHQMAFHKNVTGKVSKGQDQRSLEGKEFLVICDFCGKQFTGSTCNGKMNAHVRKVHVDQVGENQVICEVCGKKCFNSQGLRIHQKVHQVNRDSEGNPVVRERGTDPRNCQVCGKLLANRTNLRRHMQVMHPEVPTPPDLASSSAFICHFCGKAYVNSGVLRVHVEKKHGSETEGERENSTHSEHDGNNQPHN